MKKAFLLFGISIGLSFTGYAQYDDYQLKNYVNPTYKRKALDFEANTSGSFLKTTEMEGSALTGNLNLSFDQVSNSEKVQGYTIITLSGGGSKYNNGSEQKNRNAAAGINFSHTGFFFKKNKLFMEFSPSVDLGYDYEKDRVSYREEYYTKYADLKTNKFATNVNVKLGLGKGRIEDVTDARQAVYILQELQKKNILKRELSEAEIHAFAEQISLIKNKRQFDSRVKLAEEINHVDSFLVANDYIEKANSAIYFTSLYDKWMYGDRDRREAGSYIKGGIRPLFSFTDFRYNLSNIPDHYTYYNPSYTNTVWGGFVYADYRYEKPVNLKLQSSFRVGLESGLTHYKDRDGNIFQTNFNASYQLGYYLNTRTYFTGRFSQSFLWQRIPKYMGDDTNHNLISFSNLGLNAYYYLSPQVRLYGSCSFSYVFERETYDNYNRYDKYPRTSYNLGVSYAFF